ncbi:MAG: hypothetical protein HWE23_00770 [Rhodobacteraceae bacterium]|nr:hypothetical protein [Paracoccaceae bacterium]
MATYAIQEEQVVYLKGKVVAAKVMTFGNQPLKLFARFQPFALMLLRKSVRLKESVGALRLCPPTMGAGDVLGFLCSRHFSTHLAHRERPMTLMAFIYPHFLSFVGGAGSMTAFQTHFRT